MIHKRFKRIMMIINCLMAVPVIWVLIRELTGHDQLKLGRVLAAAALMAVPLCATLAITITGCAVLGDD